jgi:hypothetical protein
MAYSIALSKIISPTQTVFGQHSIDAVWNIVSYKSLNLMSSKNLNSSWKPWHRSLEYSNPNFQSNCLVKASPLQCCRHLQRHLNPLYLLHRINNLNLSRVNQGYDSKPQRTNVHLSPSQVGNTFEIHFFYPINLVPLY